MEGKIFKDTANLKQDQAKILFDYYSKAAEKIVAEEERIEKEISHLQNEVETVKKTKSTLSFWINTLFTLGFYYSIESKRIKAKCNSLNERIAEFEKQKKNIFRDYKVNKLGVAYIPVADRVKYQGKSFVVDYTNSVPLQTLKLQIPNNPQLLANTINELKAQLEEAPIVENSEKGETIATDEYSTSIQEVHENDYIADIDRSLRSISYCMGENLNTTKIDLPLAAKEGEYQDYLSEYATTTPPEGAPIIDMFNSSLFADSIKQFEEINSMRESISGQTAEFEQSLRSLMKTMSSSVQAISLLKIASTDKIVSDSNRILYQILKSPYTHYSSQAEFEEIQKIRNTNFDYSTEAQDYEPFNLKPSSRLRYNLFTGEWVGEDGRIDATPFSMHQIYEEIVSPVVQNLMEENRVERLKIYNHIKDQKMSYLTKWHQDTEAFYRQNRSDSQEIILAMQGALREYVAAYNTLESLTKTEKSMKATRSLDNAVVDNGNGELSEDTIAAYTLQQKSFEEVQNNFEAYMERLKDDIEERAEEFEHIDYYDAKLRDEYSKNVAVAANELHKLDERRKTLALINPLLAKESVLPPTPSVEELTYEHLSINLNAVANDALNTLDNTEFANEPSESDDASHEEIAQEDVPQEEIAPEEEVATEECANEPSEADDAAQEDSLVEEDEDEEEEDEDEDYEDEDEDDN